MGDCGKLMRTPFGHGGGGGVSSILVLFVQDFPLCLFAEIVFYKRGQPLYINSTKKKKRRRNEPIIV